MSLDTNITDAIEQWADRKADDILEQIISNDELSDVDDSNIDWDTVDEDAYEAIISYMGTTLAAKLKDLAD